MPDDSAHKGIILTLEMYKMAAGWVVFGLAGRWVLHSTRAWAVDAWRGRWAVGPDSLGLLLHDRGGCV